MRSTVGLLCMALLVGSSLQLYGASSKVVKLTAANFREKVVNSKGVWLVEFYGRTVFTSSMVRPLQESGS